MSWGNRENVRQCGIVGIVCNVDTEVVLTCRKCSGKGIAACEHKDILVDTWS